MSTAGPNICGTGSNYDDGADYEWEYPERIQLDDTLWAYCNVGMLKYSQRLRAQNFGFSLPSGATVTNVSFSYERVASEASTFKEYNIAMLDASGTAGTNKADTSTYWSTTHEVITKSGDGSYWGISLSPALVNDTDFGLQIKVKTDRSGTDYAAVNYVSCTVTYNTLGCIRSVCRGIGMGSFRGMM